MARHLENQKAFAESFKSFVTHLPNVFTDEQNYVRLFEIWLSNVKDERVIEHQLKKEPWEDVGDNAPWG